MKIALVTTLPLLDENKRIEEEVRRQGDEFELIDLGKFSFATDNGFHSPCLTNIKADLVLLRGIFFAIKPICTVFAEMRRRGLIIFDNNLLSCRYSIDKVADTVCLATAGLPLPSTFYSRDFDAYEEASEKIGYPLVLKPTRTGKGSGVIKIESKEELVAIISELKNQDKEAKGYILQEFIPYKYDLRILVIGDEVFTMRRIPKEGEFRANFSLGGSVEPFILDEDSKNLARRAIESVNLLVGGVDMLITEDGRRYILEVNHTPGMIGMEKATGKNITKIYLEYAIANAK
jgi:RimK family alpha-L-glutamate ligase